MCKKKWLKVSRRSSLSLVRFTTHGSTVLNKTHMLPSWELTILEPRQSLAISLPAQSYRQLVDMINWHEGGTVYLWPCSKQRSLYSTDIKLNISFSSVHHWKTFLLISKTVNLFLYHHHWHSSPNQPWNMLSERPAVHHDNNTRKASTFTRSPGHDQQAKAIDL